MIPELLQQTEHGLLDVLVPYLAVLWKEWPMDMEVTPLIGYRGTHGPFSFHGTCPHCREKAVFISATEHGSEKSDRPGWQRWYCPMRCQGCRGLILGLALVKPPSEEATRDPKVKYEYEFNYEAHYPLGSPDDTVAPEIPSRIAEDFKEALRCQWVKAFNAAVEMCRRAIEASCLEFGAKPQLSITQKIDWIHKQGRINKTLKNAAHKIRLAGNRGSHPSTTEPPISSDEATAVIEFTRHYFDHVYVVEKRMGKYDFSKSGRKVSAPSIPPTT